MTFLSGLDAFDDFLLKLISKTSTLKRKVQKVGHYPCHVADPEDSVDDVLVNVC